MALENLLQITNIVQERQAEIAMGAAVLVIMAEPLYNMGKKMVTKTEQYFKEIDEKRKTEKKEFIHYRGNDPFSTNYGV